VPGGIERVCALLSSTLTFRASCVLNFVSGVTMGVAWLAKCQVLVGALGPPVSEHKTLKIYLSDKYNYLNIFMFSAFNGNCLCILSVMHLIDRPTCNEPPLDTFKFAIQGNKCTLAIC
jgi:hypothetical protein